MEIDDFYTLDPGGLHDTSIETVDLQRVDDEGAKAMSAVLEGDLSEVARTHMAEFSSVQIMRDPQRLFDYSRTAQRFLSRLFIEIFSTSSFEEFQTYFGDLVERSEYDHVLGLLGPKQAALEIARIQLALEASGGIVEISSRISHQVPGRPRKAARRIPRPRLDADKCSSTQLRSGRRSAIRSRPARHGLRAPA